MITKICIWGFKRFKEQPFELRPLTVLAGLNGSGKSSLIHAILLVEEAARNQRNGVIQLNGPFGLELGTVGDILNWEANDVVKFEVHSGGDISQFLFEWPSEDSMYMIPTAESLRRQRDGRVGAGDFTYLSAERYGPRLNHIASSLPAEVIEVGVRGENCAQLLELQGNKPLGENRRHKSSTASSFLKYEVEYWLGEIARPVEIEAERFAGSNVYGIKFRAPGGSWVKSTNMGFGVSYALPIVLAGLTAAEGGVIVIENPEAHLHPLGQSRMGAFLAWIASRGVQVIVETHSDHVINGMRRAIAESKDLPHDSAIIHFFEGDETPSVRPLSFTENGGVSDWPDGFFDQYQVDTAALGRLRRRG